MELIICNSMILLLYIIFTLILIFGDRNNLLYPLSIFTNNIFMGIVGIIVNFMLYFLIEDNRALNIVYVIIIFIILTIIFYYCLVFKMKRKLRRNKK